MKPIYTNKADREVMADELARQIAAHNRLYKKQCMK